MTNVARDKARVFWNNRSQMVRLPKGFQFDESEVYVSRQGDAVVLSARPREWSGLVESSLTASGGLLANLIRMSPVPAEDQPVDGGQ